MIDLRSDTVTRPTAGMRAAIAAADVGDEQKGEDRTVLELERRVAALLGVEATVFVPSATMANQIALRLSSRPGDALVVSGGAHLVHSEAGGPAALAGLMTRQIDTDDGTFGAAELRAVLHPGATERPRTSLIAVENSHSNAGGRVWSLDRLGEVLTVATEAGCRTHLDGARLLNAALAVGASAARMAHGFDTVTLCLSKGLGCPFGALLGGAADAIAEARRHKQMLGGALRQSGIIAAAGLYALDHHVERLADDHCHARRLAAGLAETILGVDATAVQTNAVLIDVRPIGLAVPAFLDLAREHGVLFSAVPQPGFVRGLTHLDVTEPDIDTAVAAVRRALATAGASRPA